MADHFIIIGTPIVQSLAHQLMTDHFPGMTRKSQLPSEWCESGIWSSATLRFRQSPCFKPCRCKSRTAHLKCVYVCICIHVSLMYAVTYTYAPRRYITYRQRADMYHVSLMYAITYRYRAWGIDLWPWNRLHLQQATYSNGVIHRVCGTFMAWLCRRRPCIDSSRLGNTIFRQCGVIRTQ